MSSVTAESPIALELTPQQERELVALRKLRGPARVPGWVVAASNGCHFGVQVCCGSDCPEAPSEMCSTQMLFDKDLSQAHVRQCLHFVHLDLECPNCNAVILPFVRNRAQRRAARRNGGRR